MVLTAVLLFLLGLALGMIVRDLLELAFELMNIYYEERDR